MQKQEQLHLDYFANELVERSIRPTILYPIWHVYGYMLGMITAKLGSKTAMTCTEAVETVIDKHYLEQLTKLDPTEKKLAKKIEQFRQEEVEHKNIAIANNSEGSICQNIIAKIISLSCKVAIAASKRL